MLDSYEYYISCIEEVLRSNPEGLTVSELALILSMSRNTIGKYLELMSMSGVVDVRSIGKAKIYFLSPRIPYTHILHYLPDPVIQTDDLYQIVNVNLNGLDMWDTEEEDLIGRNLLDLMLFHGLSAEIREKIINPDRKAAFTGEIVLTQKDTASHHLMTVADMVLFDGDRGHLFIFENITELKEAEAARRRYEFLFTALSDEGYEQVCIFSPDYTLTYANGRYISTHGQETFMLKGSSLLDPFDKEARLAIRDATQAVIENDMPCRIVFQVSSVTSSQWYDMRFFPMPHDTRSVRHIMAIFRDITGFQEGGSASALLSTLLETMTEGVLTVTPAGTIISWNQGAAKITGYPAEELLGGTAQMIVAPELNGGQDVIIDAVRGSYVRDLRMTIRAKGGRKKKVLLSSSVVQDHTGEISLVMLVWREP